MLKNISVTFLIGLMIMTNTGITLHKHFCMGRLMSVGYYEQAKNCAGGDFEDPMPCCEDTVDFIEIDDLTLSHFDFESTPDLYLFSISDPTVIKSHSLTREANSRFINYSPPPLLKVSHRIDFQVFLI